MDEKANKHFSEAQSKLDAANQEMYKPEEDVVSLVVCRNAVESIENYLRGYLLQRGFETSPEEKVGHLMDRCRMLDNRFNSIRIEDIDCRNGREENQHCDDPEKLEACFNVADKLDSLMRKQGII